MKTPKHGILLQQNNNWFFRPGTKSTNPLVPLPNFKDIAVQMLSQGHIARGHCKFQSLIKLQSSGTLCRIVANHISAANLTSLEVPTLLQHHTLSPSDKMTWDSAYAEEYDGLVDLPAWQSITEHEYFEI